MKYCIREKRSMMGLSQSELARKSGVSRTTIWKLENDEDAVVMTDTLQRIADALECEVKDFILPSKFQRQHKMRR